MEEIEKTPAQTVNDAFVLIDPRYNTPLRRSSDDFLSFTPFTGQVTLSRHLARAMGFMSGDRIGFTGNKVNEFVWLFYKTTQWHNTLEIKLQCGNFSFNSKKYTEMIGGPFRFNMASTKKIRMYVDLENAIVVNLPDGEKAKMYQLYDVPVSRTDFNTQSQHEDYKKEMQTTNYIIKKQNDNKG